MFTIEASIQHKPFHHQCWWGSWPEDSCEFSFNGSVIGLLVAAGPDAGIIEYRIDNGPWEQQDLYSQWSGGLHIPWLYV